MGWQDRKPAGVGDVEMTEEGFRATVEIPLTSDGYFGRECPSCHEPFQMHNDEYKALRDDLRLTCPYCGHGDDHGDFMTTEQGERARAAVAGLGHQMVHAMVSNMLSETFGRRQPQPSNSLISIRMSYTPGSPPPIRELPEVVEKEIRRIIECSTCHGHYAVFSASAFCPVCGPRPAAETVIDQIESARQALTMEDQLGADERETLRAAGVFERIAVDALGSVVSLFEVFAREQFALRVSDAESLTQGKGNVFQRLDDSAALFAEHAALDLVSLAGAERWTRLKRAFAQRHVLEHRGGIVDERFLGQVPDSGLRAGQRLVVRRQDAAAAMEDLDALVRAFPTGFPSDKGA